MTQPLPPLHCEKGGPHGSAASSRDQWATIIADAVLYADSGRNTILCDRLPRPITLLVKNPACPSGVSLPSAGAREFPPPLADRGGPSAADQGDLISLIERRIALSDSICAALDKRRRLRAARSQSSRLGWKTRRNKARITGDEA